LRILVVASASETGESIMASAVLAFPSAERQMFLDPLLAVKHNQSWRADLIVCEFALRIVDGIQLIKLLGQQNRGIVSVLLGADEGHNRDADNLGIYHLAQPEASALKSIWKQENHIPSGKEDAAS